MTLNSGFLSLLTIYPRNQKTVSMKGEVIRMKTVITNIWSAYRVPGTAARCFRLILRLILTSIVRVRMIIIFILQMMNLRHNLGKKFVKIIYLEGAEPEVKPTGWWW